MPATWAAKMRNPADHLADPMEKTTLVLVTGGRPARLQTRTPLTTKPQRGFEPQQAAIALVNAVDAHASSILEDPTDLARFVDAHDLLTEDGEPDADKIKAAAEELVKGHPHLGRRKPPPGIAQGAQGQPTQPAGDSFADVLRCAAGN